MNYFFSDEELKFNADLNAWELLLKMGFSENALYQEGSSIRLFCPFHKDTIRRSFVVYTDRNAFKCQYQQCSANKGGNLLQMYSEYMGVEPSEVIAHIQSSGSSGNEFVERAVKCIQGGHLVDALPLLQKAVQLEPHNETTRSRLAALYLELGDRESGYREYLAVAEAYGMKQELDKTLQIYNMLLVISPEDVKIRKTLANMFAKLGRVDEALTHLKNVVDRHLRKNEISEAAQLCRKMIELSPEFAGSHRLLGEILVRQGDVFNAVEELRRATVCYARGNDLKRAKETVDAALKYVPGNVQMREMKAKIDRAIEARAKDGDADDNEFAKWLTDMKSAVGLGSSARIPTASAPSEGAAAINEQPTMITPAASADSKPPAKGSKKPVGSESSGIHQAVRPADLPTVLKDDPRVEFFRNDLKECSEEELLKHQMLIQDAYNGVLQGAKDGAISDVESKVVSEFYAAFWLATDELLVKTSS